MIRLVDCGLQEFKKNNKKIFVYGAGRALTNCLETYLREKDVECIVDNNASVWGKSIVHNRKNVEIIGVNDFKNRYCQIEKKEDYLLLINSTIYAVDIVEELNQIEELDGLSCCIQALIMNKKEPINPFDFTVGCQKIPKKIHYIWVGGKELPEEYVCNIETWKKYNPDYEIIRWDESNYDFTKCRYVKEAYEKKAWGFVPNYARLDIIYEHGGIYLDTDVEVVGNFDELLNDSAFFNMGRPDRVNQGCGFGAERGNVVIGEMRRAFEESSLLDENGKPKPCHTFIHPILIRHGFQIANQYQNIGGVVLYPNEIMSPLTIAGMENYISDKTKSIHQEVGSWRDEREAEGIHQLVGLVNK